MQIIGPKHVFLFVLLNGGILDSFMVLLVYLYANRDNLLTKMLGEHAGLLAQIISLLIASQEHVSNIADLFVLSGMRIHQKVMDNV